MFPRPMIRWPAVAIFALAFALYSAPRPDCVEESRAHFTARRYLEALKSLTGCTSGPATLKLRGLVYHRLYRADSAHFYLEEAYAAGEGGDDLLIAYAEALLWKNDFDSAGSILDNVRGKDQTDYRYAEASRHELGGRLREALAIYDQILSEDKGAHYAQYRKAELLAWTGKKEESRRHYNRLIASPHVPDEIRYSSMVRLAELKAWAKSFRAAEIELEAVLRLDPGNVQAFLVKAEICEWRGQYGNARDYYRQVLSILPDNRQAQKKLEELKWMK